jgi:Ser/Thr protein kinase RdoA (MazF antagonist)
MYQEMWEVVDTLTPDQILDLLRAWPIEFSHIEPLRGARDGLYRAVASTGEEYVFKKIGGLERRGRTEIQYRVMRYLYRHGVPTGHPLTNRDGGGYTTDGTSIYGLMPRIYREEPGLFKPDLCVWDNLGRSYGRLHSVLEAFDDPIKIPQMTLHDRLFTTGVPRLLESLKGEHLDLVLAILDELESPIGELSPLLGEQVILYDCHTGNTLFMFGQVSGFIDCDSVCLGPRICDLANLAVILILPDQSPERIRPWLEALPFYLQAYHRTNPLSQVERNALPLAFHAYVLGRLHQSLPRSGEPSPLLLTALHWLHENRDLLAQTIASGFNDELSPV